MQTFLSRATLGHHLYQYPLVWPVQGPAFTLLYMVNLSVTFHNRCDSYRVLRGEVFPVFRFGYIVNRCADVESKSLKDCF